MPLDYIGGSDDRLIRSKCPSPSHTPRRQTSAMLGAVSLLAIAVCTTAASAQQAPPSIPLSPSSTGSPTTAGGTTGPATSLQEVIVTARRREESLNTIPLSVTAISGASLDAQQVKDLRQLARIIPSLDYSDAAGGGSGRNDRSITTLTFRGLQLPTITEISPAGMEFIDGRTRHRSPRHHRSSTSSRWRR